MVKNMFSHYTCCKSRDIKPGEAWERIGKHKKPVHKLKQQEILWKNKVHQCEDADGGDNGGDDDDDGDDDDVLVMFQ